MDIHVMVSKMLIVVAELLGDPLVNDIPSIQYVEEDVIKDMCKKKCFGAYSRPAIYLLPEVDLTTAHGRSIMFHEVVHHHQEMRGRWGTVHTQERSEKREKEAYILQQMWYSNEN